ncbi:hypothetical protein PoMZ_01682 [Pyricularia oryzae]|uniref:Uncharacterized protein n=1 Tax=Pyricularia oryzae TaxID=318829 RepID=A0A4P7N772_PYROR|nr:hypothetical protein PoMZ_01682 [Pyricularia oryzae]
MSPLSETLLDGMARLSGAQIICGTRRSAMSQKKKKKSPPNTDKPSKLGIPGQERKGLATLQQRIAKSKPCGCLLHGTVRFV